MTARYVIVIFPVGYDTTGVEQFRTAWDPLADKIPAHITLVFPFLTAVREGALKSTVSNVARRHKPFPVELGNPTVHQAEYLFLLPRLGGEHVERLHRDLYSAIPDAQLRSVFVPHMTVGRNVIATNIERARRDAATKPLEVSGHATHISVYRMYPDGTRATEFAVPIGPEVA